MFCCHRVNKINELVSINKKYGVEIDVRNYGKRLVVTHDPFNEDSAVDLCEYLKYFNHAFLIINVKTDGLEFEILKLLDKYKIRKFFFLDCTMPTIVNLINKGVSEIALRVSDYECIDVAYSLIGKVKWLWIDYFSDDFSPFISNKIYNNFRLCYVSPDIKGDDETISIENIRFRKTDMICCKKRKIQGYERRLELSQLENALSISRE